MSSCSPTTSSTPYQMPTPDDTERYWNRGHPCDEQPAGRAHAELAELEAALADAATGVPSLAFVAGESGVGKTRLLAELARRRTGGARVLSGECVELGEGELPYAPLVAALRPLARDGDPALDELTRRARAELAPLLPGWRHARRPTRAADDAGGAGAAVRGAADAARARSAASGRSLLVARGHPLGRPLDARVPRLPRPQPVPPSGCSSSPPTAPTSCTAATRCARCWPSSSATPRARRIELAPLTPRRAGRAARRHPRRARPTPTWSTACTPAARATRCSPRSCWPPGSTAAARCRRRCATR